MNSLKQRLSERVSSNKTLILGIGNQLRGDDAIGPVLADRLQGKVHAQVINAEDVPENFIAPIISADPETLVIIDAASMNETPGSIAIIEIDNLASVGLSTHRASLNLFLLAVLSEIKPDIFILGIQPGATTFGTPVSQPVQEAARRVEQALLEIFPPG